ncbi:UNVERIFIED_ORG: hypothetical protein FHR35_006850 [Microbispora rosea subsp. rosea]
MEWEPSVTASRAESRSQPVEQAAQADEDGVRGGRVRVLCPLPQVL